MAISRTQFHERRKGPYAEKEDWWYLLIDSETGVQSVEHEWSYASPRGSNEGTKTMTVDEFLASNEPDEVKDKLRALLNA